MNIPPLLSVGDHYVSSPCQRQEVAEALALPMFPDSVRQKLFEVGPRRIETMDEGNVRLQVLSQFPVVIGADDCKQTNDELRQDIERSSGRLAGFAALPMAEPSCITAELERCVNELGFAGAVIPNDADGIYYDGPEYLPMWEAAERLDVPIFLQSCPQSSQVALYFGGNYSEDVAFALSTHAWGGHASCALHFIRIYAAGIFDRLPKLKLILGHLGETLPFMLDRIDRKLALTPDSKLWKTSIRVAFARNVWITTGGMFDMDVLKLVLAKTSVDKLMFSVSYPFESTLQSVQFMETIKRSGLVSEEDFHKIAYGNAERLLRVNLDQYDSKFIMR